MEDKEKLAKFAGFYYDVDKYMWTRYPDGTYITEWEGSEAILPDFTSLDVLFQWCVPKLRHWMLATTVEGAIMGWAQLPDGSDAWTEAATPGEALREVILALVNDVEE